MLLNWLLSSWRTYTKLYKIKSSMKFSTITVRSSVGTKFSACSKINLLSSNHIVLSYYTLERYNAGVSPCVECIPTVKSESGTTTIALRSRWGLRTYVIVHTICHPVQSFFLDKATREAKMASSEFENISWRNTHRPHWSEFSQVHIYWRSQTTRIPRGETSLLGIFPLSMVNQYIHFCIEKERK